MLLDVFLGGVYSEGGEVCGFFWVHEGRTGKSMCYCCTCMNVKRYIMIFYHDISVMEPAGAY